MSGLRQWWGSLCERGPQFGYVVNPVKTWFVVKPAHLATAKKLFAGTGVNISVEGRPYLGATIGTREFTRNYVGAKVSEWSSEVLLLAKIAESQPQAAYSALTHNLSSRWRFVARTILQVGELFLPLENVIRCTLLSLLVGTSPPNDVLCDLFVLPPHWGGLGISTLLSSVIVNIQLLFK